MQFSTLKTGLLGKSFEQNMMHFNFPVGFNLLHAKQISFRDIQLQSLTTDLVVQSVSIAHIVQNVQTSVASEQWSHQPCVCRLYLCLTV